MESNLKNSILREHNIISEGQCVFIQRWREVFNDKTIDTYKCRLTNAHGILVEYLDIIKKVNASIIQDSNIKPVTEESIKKLKSDTVLKNNDLEMRNLILSRLGKQRGTLTNLISEFELFIKKLDGQYINWILRDLKNNIDKNNIKQILKDVENLATELVYREWSKSSLYRLVKIIFIESSEEFEVKWLKFVSSICGEKEIFKCYVKVKSDKFYRNTISGTDLKEILGPRKSRQYNIKDDELYFEFEGEAYSEDLNSFMEYVSRELSDIEAEYVFFNEEIKFYKSKAIVILPTNNITEYNISKYNAKEYYKNNGMKLNSSMQKYKEIQKSITGQEINIRLKNILNQYKLGYNSDSVENWFSSFWFALESLVATNQYEFIIDQITNIVTPILTVRYPKKILENLIQDLKRCNIDLNDFDINSSECEDIMKLVYILKSEEQINRLKEKVDDYTLLIHRIEDISSWLKNAMTLKDFLENHYNNIELHLKRLFRIRNSFVHSASIEYDLYPITMHLHSYLRDVLEEIFIALDKGCTYDISQIYSCANMKYIMMIDKLKNQGKSDYDPQLICFDNYCYIR